MGFDGKLSESTAIRAFHEVLDGRKSGQLAFRHDGATDADLRFHFLYGALAGIDGPSFDRAYVRVLLGKGDKPGRASARELEEIHQKHPILSELDTELVKADFFTRKELKELHLQAVKEALWSTFSWHDGGYEFQDVRPPRDAPEPEWSLPTADLLLEGIRQIKDVAVVERELGKKMGTKLKAPQFQLIEAQMRSLRPEEGFILSRIDGTVTVEQVCALSSLPQEQTLKVLYALIAAGLLEFDEPRVVLESRMRATAPPQSEPAGDVSEGEGVFEVDLTGVAIKDEAAPPPVEAGRLPRSSGAVPRGSGAVLRAAMPGAAGRPAPATKTPLPRAVEDEDARVIDGLGPRERKARAREALDTAKKFLDRESWQPAIPHLKEAVRLTDRDPEAWFLLGKAQRRTPGSQRDAEESIMRAIDLNYKHADYYSELGLLYKEAGNLPKARTQFENALHWDPVHDVARAELKGEGVNALKEGLSDALDGVKDTVNKVWKDVFRGRRR